MSISYEGVLTFPADKTKELKTEIIEEAQRRASGFNIDPKIVDAIKEGIIYFEQYKDFVRKDYTVIAKVAADHDIPIEGKIRYFVTSDNNITTEGVLIVKDGFLEDLQGDEVVLRRLSDRVLLREIKRRNAVNEETIKSVGLKELSGRDAIVEILNDDDLSGSYYLGRKQEI